MILGSVCDVNNYFQRTGRSENLLDGWMGVENSFSYQIQFFQSQSVGLLYMAHGNFDREKFGRLSRGLAGVREGGPKNMHLEIFETAGRICLKFAKFIPKGLVLGKS